MKASREKVFDSQLPPVSDHAQQGLALSFPKIAEPMPVPMAMVVAQPSKHAALLLCMQASGLQDQDIARALGIAAPQWSKIKSRTAHFPEDKETQLMLACGNYIPLYWQIHACGFDPESLRPLRSELEAKLEKSQQRVADLEREYEITIRALRQVRAGP